jgi:hypothetical protein
VCRVQFGVAVLLGGPDARGSRKKRDPDSVAREDE